MPPAPPPPTPTAPTPEAKPKKSKFKKILLIVGGVILTLAIIFGALIFEGIKESPVVRATVTEFLSLTSEEKFEADYEMTSTQFQEATTLKDFERSVDLMEAQYTGFKDQEQTGFNIKKNVGQPTVFEYSGTITYDNGDIGKVSATLIKENDQWKIYGIFINIGFDRLEKFKQQESDSVLGVSSSLE